MAQRANIDYDQIKAAARQGNGGLFQMAGAGGFTDGNVLIYDANGNSIDSGVAPGGGTGGVNAKTGSYTADGTDAGKLVTFNSASAVTLTLPSSPPSGSWYVAVQNVGAGLLTISRNGLNIDGAATDLSISTNQGVLIFTDGSNYFTERGASSGGGGSSSPYLAPTLYDPTGISWSWVNQGTAAVTNASSGIFMTIPQGGGFNLRIRIKTLPTPPYIVEAIFIPHFVGTIPSTGQEGGMILRNSTSGKLVTLNAQLDEVSSSNWDSPTAFNSGNYGEQCLVPRMFQLKISDDNAGTKLMAMSTDLVNYSIRINWSTAFITPDQIGWYAGQTNNNPRQGLTLISWHEH